MQEVGDMSLAAPTLAMLLQHPVELARQLTLGTHTLFLVSLKEGDMCMCLVWGHSVPVLRETA